MASSSLLPIATSAGMAACSLGLTRYIYSRTYKAATLNFGVLTTTGFTLSALCYALGDRLEITGALLGGATSALLAGMTTASAFRSRKPVPFFIALLSFGSMIVHISSIEKVARRRKQLQELQELQNASLHRGAEAQEGDIQNKQET
eukprot:Phypoly_transcript_21838.p1 GENE.Phypoly_transcript_21838~~Phypoly_transcript_21838.p1  ORF type:complete len:147 (+),score=14.00 Phypoly_transcript_21838:115-555(+)